MNGGLVLGEELNLPSGFAFVPDVTVCGCESLFVQVTVSPTLAFIGLGENASVVLLAAPDTMLTATSAAKAGDSETGTSITASTAASPTATAIFEFISY